ncbi:hypothetical protein DOY81_009184 [Sarcophaga bullata]|nr:hypothetical protein DOY81_009184 [Sarcophaga bullata]
MRAYEVFLVQTQPIVNYLFIPVIATLPLLWFGDCKRTMSLLFKHISLPEGFDITKEDIEITNNFQIFMPLALGVFSCLLHKYWRLYVNALRCDILQQEAKFTENSGVNERKITLLQTINNIIERRTKSTGKCTNNIKVERMIDTLDETMSPKINSDFEDVEE